MSKKQIPLVVVVGRPNVGKSTLYNRLVPRGDAVVDDAPGVTRDRREGETEWIQVPFRLMDTGGLVPGTVDTMETAILTQGEEALESAHLILFMVDAREGVTALDRDIAEALRPRAERVLLVANKVEGKPQELAAAEAAELGFGMPWLVSAEHGQGTGDLLDAIIDRIPRLEPRSDEDRPLRLALLGRPNVGKSSIANRLLGEDRFIVHDSPGTTRDAVDASFRYDGVDFVLVDTAGLRRRSHVAKGVEFYSTLRTRRSLMNSDVALFVLDATEKISAQDLRIAGEISTAHKSMIFVLNKWDLVEKVTGTTEAFARLVREKFPRIAGAPMVFVSAKTGQRVTKIPELAKELWEQRRRRVSTSDLNDVLKAATENLHPPMRSGTKRLKMFYVTQTGYEPPMFTIFVNDPKSAAPSYRKYLLGYFREALGLQSTPVRLTFRARR